ncbi:MAG: acyltransferase, partial [Methyloceanibacter sp.]
LRSPQPLGEFHRRRALRIVPVLVFWSAVYAAWPAFELDRFLTSMAHALTGPVRIHLWYLYALIGLYAFTPIIAAFYRSASDAEKLYFIVMWIAVASIFPIMNKGFELQVNIAAYKLAYFGGLIGYFVVGAYLYEKVRSSQRVGVDCLAAYIVFSAATAVATYLYSVTADKPNALFFDYLRPFVMIASVALFALVLARPLTGPIGRTLQFVSRFSLGIYCIHILVLDVLGRMPFMALGRTEAAWVFIPLLAICAVAISLAIIWLMRLVPPLRLVT